MVVCVCFGVFRLEEVVFGYNNWFDFVLWFGVGINIVGGYDYFRGRWYYCDWVVFFGNCLVCVI